MDVNSINNGYLHLDQSWWDQTLMEDIAINGKVYFLAGDALVTDDEATYGVYFNKDVIEEYNLENPYDLVRDGSWTLDKMYEMAKQVELTHGAFKSFEPIDGDKWGIVTQVYDFQMFMQGCEQTMIDNTGDKPVLRVMDEENVNTFNKLTTMFYDNVNVGVADFHGRWDSGVYEKQKEIFTNGNALFMPGAISYVGEPVFRESEISYGILPMPKRSNLQEYYTAGVNTYNYSVIAIPITNRWDWDLDVTCYALEAMAYYGKEIVAPEYYDRTLDLKRFMDEESAEMLDLILYNRTYDFGSVFNIHSGMEYNGTLYFYTNMLGERRTDIASAYDALEQTFKTGIDAIVAMCYN